MGDLERLAEVRVNATGWKGDYVFARKLRFTVEERCSMIVWYLMRLSMR